MGSEHARRARQVGRFAAALAAFVRAAGALPLAAVSQDAQCQRRAAELLELLASQRTNLRARRPSGRRQVHDRGWARSCLLDIALADPDGMPSPGRLIRDLELRFESAGRPTPGTTWLKAAVREFCTEAREFEMDAVATFNASPALRAVFLDAGDFLRFRRTKARAALAWAEQSEIRSQFSSPEKLLEAAFLNGLSPHP